MRPDRPFEASPELDARILAPLRAMPYFRVATPAEIERSFASYERRDPDALCRTWAEVADPTRATMPAALRWAYMHAGRGPRAINEAVFLDSLRAALRAGERFRQRLAPAVREILMTEFPYLERRHEHVPEGDTPTLEFPELFASYLEYGLESGDLDDSRARWQLAVALNEVQQSCYSDFAAELFGLPELHRHAARERELARNYFGHWSPRCTLDLWRETIYVLDALNAATFELVCTRLVPHAMSPRRLLGAKGARAQWRAFVANLDTPQWLLEVPASAG